VAHVTDAFTVAVAGVGACRVLIGGREIDRGQGRKQWGTTIRRGRGKEGESGEYDVKRMDE